MPQPNIQAPPTKNGQPVAPKVSTQTPSTTNWVFYNSCTDFTFSNGPRLGAAFALIGAAICLIVRLKAKKDKFDLPILGDFVSTGFGFYAIFQCFLLLWAAFDPSQLNKISDLPMYLGIIALAGIVVAAVSIVQYVKK